MIIIDGVTSLHEAYNKVKLLNLLMCFKEVYVISGYFQKNETLLIHDVNNKDVGIIKFEFGHYQFVENFVSNL